MSLIDSQDEIIALLKTIPNVLIFEDEVADEVIVPTLPNSDQIQPFITVSFGGMVDPPRRTKGIVGAKADTQETTIVVQCVGSTKGTARQVFQLMWDVLIGFTPTGCGEIRSALYGGTGKISHLGNPSRFAAVQSFRYYQNSDYLPV